MSAQKGGVGGAKKFVFPRQKPIRLPELTNVGELVHRTFSGEKGSSVNCHRMERAQYRVFLKISSEACGGDCWKTGEMVGKMYLFSFFFFP